MRSQHLDHDPSRWVEYILLPLPAIHRLLKLGRKDSPSEREMILLLLLTTLKHSPFKEMNFGRNGNEIWNCLKKSSSRIVASKRISIMISFHFIANRRKNFIHGSYIFRWWIFFCLTEKKIHAFIDKKTYCSDRILNTVLASVMGGLEGFNFSYKPCNLNIFRSDYLEKYTRDNLKPTNCS